MRRGKTKNKGSQWLKTAGIFILGAHRYSILYVKNISGMLNELNEHYVIE